MDFYRFEIEYALPQKLNLILEGMKIGPQKSEHDLTKQTKYNCLHNKMGVFNTLTMAWKLTGKNMDKTLRHIII